MSVSVRVANRRRFKAVGLEQLDLGRMVALLLIVTLVALFYAYSAARTRSLHYQASRALEVQRELMEEGRRLKVELNILRSPARLEAEGLRLGLATPKAGQVRALP